MIANQHTGIGITPDSVNYIATARNIASGNGIISFNNNPLILHPPLYPASLALIDFIFRIDPVKSAGIFNSILFAIIIYLSGLLIFKHLNSSLILSILGTVTILVGIPIIIVSLLALSETLFIFLILVYLIVIELYLEKQSITLLLILSSTVALACLTRYIGVTLIITGSTTILLLNKNKIFLKIRNFLIFVCISAIPISVYLVRNYILSGTFAGYRLSSKFTLYQNIKFTFHTIISWYNPQRTLFNHSLLMILITVAVTITGWGIIIKRKRLSKILTRKFNLVVLIITYLGFLIISSSIIAFNTIGDRLLSPIFIPITISVLILFSKILTFLTNLNLPRAYKIVITSAAIFLWCVLLFSNYSQITMPFFENQMIREMGYNAYYWKENQTARYFGKNIKLNNNHFIYSNEPYALYILTGFKSEISPNYYGLFNGLPIYKKTDNILELKEIWPRRNDSYLVWFDRYSYLKNSLYKLEELKKIANFQLVTRLDDGTIYLLQKK